MHFSFDRYVSLAMVHHGKRWVSIKRDVMYQKKPTTEMYFLPKGTTHMRDTMARDT